MTREDPIVIVSAVRTPMGGFLGDFKDVNAATLGAAAVRAAVERARLQADEVDEAVLGCVLAAGQGQAPLGHLPGLEGGGQRQQAENGAQRRPRPG
ncbi:hypothetical protein LZM63_16825, partial [Pseudomonas aeruginosa]|nr:hypothetical protein [Pseudomonas aeruginosa]